MLLSNGETVSLVTNYTGISSRYGTSTSYNFDTSFSISDADAKKLKENDVTDIRINYIDGHYDRTLKEEKRNLIAKMLKLVDEYKFK